MWLKEGSCQWQLMPRMYQRSISWQHVYVLGTIIMSGALTERLTSRLRNEGIGVAVYL